ncbi:FMN-dependent NADH-azoreductase [Novosphingobium lentum]|uniref:FMN-dependent NADH-azoreductase n=1 Tax=Novosphingobium lentum TaxID=145287 RepID=UPI00083770E8|nr:NAD(P)H-dependent oxidoreductase [Novosphingobium lentum]
MANILLLTSSPRNDQSLSTKVAKSIVHAIEAAEPGTTTVVRDLGANPPPHIGADYVEGRMLAATERTPGQQQVVGLAEDLIAELMACDTLVIASAMVNFGIPSGLKSWLDHVLMAGKTFAYVDGAPKGLVTGRVAYVVQARGGVYTEGPMKALDFQEPYLRATLGFMGITDVRIVNVEGIAFGPEATEKAVAAAVDRIPGLLKAA